MQNRSVLACCLPAFIAALPMQVSVATGDAESFNSAYQTTYIWQRKQAFDAPYSGVNSLTAEREKSYSITATAAFGWRPWEGAGLYIDPELAQGVPLSHLTGLGGMSNGEMARTSGANPTLYRARLFLRQVWGLGGEQEMIASGANQLAAKLDKRRVTLTLGNVSVLDIFDANAYSDDPRTQFINWSIMTHGAYDFAADSRGYTWGAALEWQDGRWALRAGRFIQPQESNGLALDRHIFSHFGDQVEGEHAHGLGGFAGKIRLLVFRNVAMMGSYADALAARPDAVSLPAVADVRRRHAKVGYGINIEQALPLDVGLFARASWADGKTETYAFAEIDRSVSAGMSLTGAAWSRPDDIAGVAGVRNGMSAPHQAYLAAGGLGFFAGDGKLNYGAENIGELFYNAALGKTAHIGFNFQRIVHPAYNRERGPVTIASVRLHSDF